MTYNILVKVEILLIEASKIIKSGDLITVIFFTNCNTIYSDYDGEFETVAVDKVVLNACWINA